MAGVLSGLLFLLILVIGFYWDVAWHIDNGRDTQLFTPSHTMILVGLGGLVYAAFLTMGFATLDKARVGFKYGVANVPWSSVLLLCLGFGGMAAFPLDNLWHETYGIDVTLWSPTHLQLVGGGALGTVALFLMLAEALPFARPTAVGRAIFVLTGGTVLVALSAVQAEFDYGVPQFQALYLPLLIMVAAGLGLVLARIALGPWGAVKVVWRLPGAAGVPGPGRGGRAPPHRAPVPPVPGVGAGGRGGGGAGGDAVAAAIRCGGRGVGGDGRVDRGAGVGERVGVGAGAHAAVDGGEGVPAGPGGGGGGGVAGGRVGPGVCVGWGWRRGRWCGWRRVGGRRRPWRGRWRADAGGGAGGGGGGPGGGAGVPAAAQRGVGRTRWCGPRWSAPIGRSWR